MITKNGGYHDPHYCPYCDSADIEMGSPVYSDGVMCEVDVRCIACDGVAFWAYGWFDIPMLQEEGA